MSSLADDVCAEIRTQFAAADHFKRLWMQSSDELERANGSLKILRGAMAQIDGYSNAVSEDRVNKIKAVATKALQETK